MVPATTTNNFPCKRKAEKQNKAADFAKRHMPAFLYPSGLVRKTNDVSRDSIFCRRYLAWEDSTAVMIGIMTDHAASGCSSSLNCQSSPSDQGVQEYGAVVADLAAQDHRFEISQHITCRLLRGSAATFNNKASSLIDEASCTSSWGSHVSCDSTFHTWGPQHHCQSQQHRDGCREPLDAEEWGWFVDAEDEDQPIALIEKNDNNVGIARQRGGKTLRQTGETGLLLVDERDREQFDFPAEWPLRRTQNNVFSMPCPLLGACFGGV